MGKFLLLPFEPGDRNTCGKECPNLRSIDQSAWCAFFGDLRSEDDRPVRASACRWAEYVPKESTESHNVEFVAEDGGPLRFTHRAEIESLTIEGEIKV